jgi:hypothetical protein
MLTLMRAAMAVLIVVTTLVVARFIGDLVAYSQIEPPAPVVVTGSMDGGTA